jgi:hypothetical protein
MNYIAENGVEAIRKEETRDVKNTACADHD